MYYSQSVNPQLYTANVRIQNHPLHQHNGVMTFTSRRQRDSLHSRALQRRAKAEIGKFLVGVFVGDECRGIAVEKDGYLFITAHGEQTDESETDPTCLRHRRPTGIQRQHEIEWSGTLTGSLTTPVSLRLGEATGILLFRKDCWFIKSAATACIFGEILATSESASLILQGKR